MTARNDERRPGEGAASNVDHDTDIATVQRPSDILRLEHTTADQRRRRHRWASVYERRRIALRADQIIGREIAPPREPSTFGLTDAELLSHARHLRADGWSADMVAEVLARPAFVDCQVETG